MILSSLGLSIPPYWLALLAIIIFCVVPYRLFNFPLFPSGNIISFGKPFAGSFWDRIWHLALPVLVLSVTFVATWTRYMRSSFLEVIRSDFIRTARAKGVSEGGIIWKHALRNALVPLVTTVAVSIPWSSPGLSWWRPFFPTLVYVGSFMNPFSTLPMYLSSN